MTIHRLPGAALAGLVTVLLLAPASGRAGDRSALRTLEGVVVALGEAEGEGGLAVVTARLAIEGSEESIVQLAPAGVLEEIGFPVEPGDRLRLRTFVLPDGTVRAERSLNLTRGAMTRLRSLHRVPLWEASGAWLGGPVRHGPGSAGAGKGPGGRGSGPPH